MRRRHFALLAIVLLLALGVWVAMRTEQPHTRPITVPMAAGIPPPNESSPAPRVLEAPPASPTPNTAPPSLPAHSATPGARASGVAATPAASIAPPDEAAMIEVDKVSLMIRDYRTIAGENPVGTNAEIMAAVMGDNPNHARLGPPEGVALNEKGELIDRWGTPYFFHQLSRDHMEIRSAGPDKVLWTADDPVIK